MKNKMNPRSTEERGKNPRNVEIKGNKENTKKIQERRENRRMPERPRRPVEQMPEEFAFQMIERFENNFPVSVMEVIDSMKKLEIEEIETEEYILTIKKV